MSASERLRALGIVLPPVATPAGTYIPARRHDDLVFTSGQLPMVDGELMKRGIVGPDAQHVTSDEASRCAVAAMLNGLSAAADAGGGLDAISGVVRLTAYIAAAPTFTGHPAVVNEASALLGEIFGDDGRHARSVVGVASLPLGSPVELELVVSLRS